MEGAEVAESFNEWEQIQFETVADFSIFPQLNHEGLKIPPPPPPPDAQIHSEQNSADACNTEAEERLPLDSDPKVGNNIGKSLKLRIQILRSWVAWVASRGCGGGGGGGGLWSFGSMSGAVAAAAVLLCLRVQKWRLRVREKSENPLVLVIKEKDQKISQLLLQIAKMHESLSARRIVPVIRVLG